MDEKWTDYLFSYRFDGSEWGFDIRARSPDEAKARLKALAFARYDGELVLRIPVKAPSWVWRLLRRLFKRPASDRAGE